MSTKKYKLTAGIRSDKAPVFMEGEAPGVFVVHEFEIAAGESEVSMARWALDKEDELIEKSVELKWEEIT